MRSQASFFNWDHTFNFKWKKSLQPSKCLIVVKGKGGNTKKDEPFEVKGTLSLRFTYPVWPSFFDDRLPFKTSD